ncbi:hypothetical protein RAA17_18630 [Komagataeibacter rhaeticus]|nr:hypothetical protein [Komagataeibacter rhaeticus]
MPQATPFCRKRTGTGRLRRHPAIGLPGGFCGKERAAGPLCLAVPETKRLAPPATGCRPR